MDIETIRMLEPYEYPDAEEEETDEEDSDINEREYPNASDDPEPIRNNSTQEEKEAHLENIIQY